eukprot:gb/GECG01012147.1/.p1 GENE.gb/GECG01012147.1/~~gb/GECG01012147.1/.p1  ORF type:complete len:532 (+),score=93.91 gb/GECG01012147.1/:1-1596(+)
MPRIRKAKRKRSNDTEEEVALSNDPSSGSRTGTAIQQASASSISNEIHHSKVTKGVQTESASQKRRKKRKRRRQLSPSELEDSIPPANRQQCGRSDDLRKFRYGNFDTYKGFQVGGAGYSDKWDEEEVFADRRLMRLDPELFSNANVLDIGCNAGYVPIAIAEKFSPRFVLGVDIDPLLIKRARKLVRERATMLMCRDNEEQGIGAGGENEHETEEAASASAGAAASSSSVELKQRLNGPSHSQQQNHNHDNSAGGMATEHEHEKNCGKRFPLSLPITHGIISKQPTLPAKEQQRSTFPFNVLFRHEDFLEALREGNHPRETYNVIICWNVTKWIQLNRGDSGIQELFFGIKELLVPGGRLILQAPAWRSYKKKQNMHKEIKGNFEAMEFFPEDFEAYLLQKVHFHSVRHVVLNASQRMDQLSQSNILCIFTKPLDNPWETGELAPGSPSLNQVTEATDEQHTSHRSLWGGASEGTDSLNGDSTADKPEVSNSTQAASHPKPPSESKEESVDDYSRSASYSSSKSSSRTSS